MKILCPHCGTAVVVKGLGRRRLNIPLKNICESLHDGYSPSQAGQMLGCSESYIFAVLKANNLKLSDVRNGRGVPGSV